MSTSNNDVENILVVDDTPTNLKVLSAMLNEAGYQVRPAISGELAIKAAQSRPPDLILMDIMMPDMDGYEVCTALKNIPEIKDIPIIFISALDETMDKVKAFQVGGVDYITKPFQIEEVLARIENHLMLYRQRKEIEGLNALKDLLIRTVSHDLKNPISNIMGYAELLLVEREAMSDQTQREQLLQQVYQSAEHMYTLVTNLLDLTRIEDTAALFFSPVLLADVLETQLEQCQLLASEKGITVEVDGKMEGFIWADQSWIGEVFANLLMNAIKYTAVGGHVYIRSNYTDDVVTVHVEDNGRGIAKAHLPHLFEKFYRIEQEEEENVGTGLGLSIAQAIAERHNGKITVQSEVGKGSVFSVHLPRHHL